MLKDNPYWRVAAAGTLIATQVIGGCAPGYEKITFKDPLKPTSTPPPDFTPIPSRTLTPSSTPTSTPTPTRTPTPTNPPNYEATNVYKVETTLDGETVTLENYRIGAAIVWDLPLLDPLIYGVETDETGRTLNLIENFDCQFDILRAEGKLDEQVEDSMTLDKWRVNAVLDKMTVTKAGSIGSIEILTSQDFMYKGEKHTCKEYTQKQRIYDRVRPFLQKLLDLVNK